MRVFLIRLELMKLVNWSPQDVRFSGVKDFLMAGRIPGICHCSFKHKPTSTVELNVIRVSRLYSYILYILGFPGGSDGRESTCNVGNCVQSLGWEDPLKKGRREWLPTPVLLSGEFHGQRSLTSGIPWGCKESDTTEQLTFTFIQLYCIRNIVLK